MKHHSPTGRRNHGRPLQGFLNKWGRNGQQVAQLHDRYIMMMMKKRPNFLLFSLLIIFKIVVIYFTNFCTVIGIRCIQQEEDSFYQQIGLKFEEETNKMLHLEHGFVWCWNLDASGSRSEIPGKFWNVVLQKDGEDQLDRSCEKWRRVT